MVGQHVEVPPLAEHTVRLGGSYSLTNITSLEGLNKCAKRLMIAGRTDNLEMITWTETQRQNSLGQ